MVRALLKDEWAEISSLGRRGDSEDDGTSEEKLQQPVFRSPNDKIHATA